MNIKAKTSFSLKDQLFNEATVTLLTTHIHQAYPKFPQKKFQQTVLANFPNLELKARIRHIIYTLKTFLPSDLSTSTELLIRALPPPLDPTLTDDDFGDFIWVVPGEFIATYCCNSKHLKTSLAFLKEATKRFSAEYSIRPFINQFPKETMTFINQCAKDKNYHVRRLASEGIRPFLPWAPRAPLKIESILDILKQLHTDKTRYVTRSVANNLNDISKISPQTVLNTLEHWHKLKLQAPNELSWMTRHSLRTLLKKNNPAAFEYLGFPAAPKFKLTHMKTSKIIKIGESFKFSCIFTSQQTQKLKITLAIYFLKANGTHSCKVFAMKEKEIEVNSGEQRALKKQVLFKPMTTQTLYPGIHFAELIVNGTPGSKQSFELLA